MNKDIIKEDHLSDESDNTIKQENPTEFAKEVNQAEGEFKKLEKEMADLNDKYLRLYAEYDNFRKRSARERLEYMSTAGEDVLKSFLTVVDDFERGIKANETITDVKPINEGMLLIFNKMQNILKQKGIEAMQSTGKDFDPETMEAITNIPAPTPDLKGKVIDEVEKGYLMNGKVIRYAKVVVGS
ncbi:MAG: nucleotide exchange factor GrpE [Bacteroidia bacterium]